MSCLQKANNPSINNKNFEKMTTTFKDTKGNTYKVRINKTAKTATFTDPDLPRMRFRVYLDEDGVEYFTCCPTDNDWMLLLRTAYRVR